MKTKILHDEQNAVHPDRTHVYLHKKRLRKKLLTRLNKTCGDEVTRVSREICTRLTKIARIRGALHIATFASIGNEINLAEFAAETIRRGAKIYYPRFNKKNTNYDLACVQGDSFELVTGYMGILEPKADNDVVDDYIKQNELLWLVPGIAFDKHGNRLGRGRGFYDRLLKGANGVKVGIAYDWQIVDNVPMDSADVCMDYLLTWKCFSSCHI